MVTTQLFALALVCVLLPPGSCAQAANDSDAAVELTQVELFSLPDWQHKSVAVEGFVLGMSRSQVFEIAKADNLALRPNGPPRRAGEGKAPCREASCSVSQVNGNWIGVDLFFDADRLTKITVSVPIDADPEVKKVNIAKSFKGLTYEFFNGYSDSLREKVLGSVKGKETPIKTGSQISALTSIEYDYSQSGVVVRVTVDRRDHPSKPFDLEVDFATASPER